ncbi:hypothetical protein LCGC14_0899060 [marine sediment metagenome]|uniref:Uncharacterized protein n=1 Tax=marine sediment metagenome TaxID=412755 RepID=A0A0F9S3V9_9ZZZZ
MLILSPKILITNIYLFIMMKAKKWKSVVLKNARVRQIRTNFRVVLNLTIHAELKRLSRLKELYYDKRISRALTPSQRKREIDLSDATADLLTAISHSPLRCYEASRCLSLESSELSSVYATLASDMVWNPLTKSWICIDCYNYYYGTEEKKQVIRDIFEKIKQEEKSFDEWFKKQVEF